jgi:hypothetical protein
VSEKIGDRCLRGVAIVGLWNEIAIVGWDKGAIVGLWDDVGDRWFKE